MAFRHPLGTYTPPPTRRGLQTVNGRSRGGFGGSSSASYKPGPAFQTTAFTPGQSNVSAAGVNTALSREREMSERASQVADPWASQRGQYQTSLNELMQGGQSATAADPSYQFRFREGQRAAESSLASQGLLGSGRAAMELQQYGQESASQEFEKQARRLMELAGVSAGSPEASANILASSGQFGAKTAVKIRGQDIGMQESFNERMLSSHLNREQLRAQAHDANASRKQRAYEFDRSMSLEEEEQRLDEEDRKRRLQQYSGSRGFGGGGSSYGGTFGSSSGGSQASGVYERNQERNRAPSISIGQSSIPSSRERQISSIGNRVERMKKLAATIRGTK